MRTAFTLDSVRMATAGAALLAMMACTTTPPPKRLPTLADWSWGEAFRECPQCPEMLVVGPGEFTMGAEGGEPGRPEGPPRLIDIRYPFAVGRYEVTVEEYGAFVTATGHPVTGGCRVWAGEWVYPPENDFRSPGWRRSPQPRDPVACVSWLDAKAYVAWLTEVTGSGYRLLSEAEWEYVARAGTDTSWPWGEEPSDGCQSANIYDASGARDFAFPWEPEACDDGFGAVAPVGSFTPNAFGLYDLIGNVWEWNEDCYKAPYHHLPVNGGAYQEQGSCERRSVRGGSWITRTTRQRSAFRGRDPETTVFSFFGFRVARDLAPGP